ncbi:winged helix-turn-helix transcriptional regulator [bacterium]|nr:winged helix-turn-helix transcriptional regulator [bacterium]
MEEHLKIIRALSDKNRIRIVKMLEMKPLCVCEITFVLGLAASTTSKHLSILKNAGIIFEQKDGKWVNYHLNRATRNPVLKDMLELIGSRIHEDPVIRSDADKVKHADRTEILKN